MTDKPGQEVSALQHIDGIAKVLKLVPVAEHHKVKIVAGLVTAIAIAEALVLALG